MTQMRPISVEGYPTVEAPSDFGAVPMLQWIDIADLVVDESYQRDIRSTGRKNVVAIATAFEWIKFSPVVVSPVAGGKFAIIDGQHRTSAAALVGITKVPCQIVVADRQSQAKAFAAINGGTTRVSRQAIFNARAAIGDTVEAAIVAACSNVGVTILRYPRMASELKHGETIAVGAIETIFRLHGAPLLNTVLRCILTDERPGLLVAQIIQSVGVVLADHPEWVAEGDRLVQAFDDIALDDALIDARAKAARLRGVAATDLLQATIIDHLSKALQGRRAA